MRRRALSIAFLTISLIVAGWPTQAAPPERGPGYHTSAEAMLARRAAGRASTARAPSSMVLDDFELVGHTDLGATDTSADVWVHEGFAYVGTWIDPCTGRGVKVVDVSDPANPVMIGRVAGIAGTSAEDVVVRSVSTPSFTGDLLVAGIQQCGESDADGFGVDLWDVTDPANPVHLTHFGLTHGGGGVHELDMFQRGQNVYVLTATPDSDWYEDPPVDQLGILDVTDPANPVVVGGWSAREEGLSPGPWYGQGSFGSHFAHSARVSEDGTQALVSYWDLGVVTLDITDVTDPVMVSRTTYPADAEGNAHSAAEHHTASRDFLLVNDEDFGPDSPTYIRYGSGTGIASESPAARPVWSHRGHEVSGRVVRPARQGCSADDYGGVRAEGRIVVVTTFFGFLEPPRREPACTMRRQQRVAAAVGAAALVHDFRSPDTSPQWWDIRAMDIPVLYTDPATAGGMVESGRATLEGQRPSFGYLRVYDAATGEQVASFDDLPNVHRMRAPKGDWSIHNTEVSGDRAYSAWYSHGIVALGLSPLSQSPPGDPVMVGQFVPPGAPSQSDFLWEGVAEVWGVFVRESDGLVFASDMNSGLWIVRPVGDAAP